MSDSLLTDEQKEAIIAKAEEERRARVQHYNDNRGSDPDNVMMLFWAIPLTLLAMITTFGIPWIPVIWGFVIYKWIKNNKIKLSETPRVPYIPMSEKEKYDLIASYESKIKNSIK